MTRTFLGLCIVLMHALSACGHQSATTGSATVREIQISEMVTPDVLYAKLGEEIR